MPLSEPVTARASLLQGCGECRDLLANSVYDLMCVHLEYLLIGAAYWVYQ